MRKLIIYPSHVQLLDTAVCIDFRKLSAYCERCARWHKSTVVNCSLIKTDALNLDCCPVRLHILTLTDALRCDVTTRAPIRKQGWWSSMVGVHEVKGHHPSRTGLLSMLDSWLWRLVCQQTETIGSSVKNKKLVPTLYLTSTPSDKNILFVQILDLLPNPQS